MIARTLSCRKQSFLITAYLSTGARDNVIFALTRHGGHLGFFEGWIVYGRSLTWLDRVVVEYVNSVLAAFADVSPESRVSVTS